MAFYITAYTHGLKHLYLHANEQQWTDEIVQAYGTMSWDEVERKFKDLMTQVERHEKFIKPVTELLKEAFPKGTGTLCIIEDVTAVITKRSVTLK